MSLNMSANIFILHAEKLLLYQIQNILQTLSMSVNKSRILDAVFFRPHQRIPTYPTFPRWLFKHGVHFVVICLPLFIYFLPQEQPPSAL